MAEALECPVCLTLPEGEVHQCNEGHCYCADCWNRLDPRLCPECRQPVSQANRNRAVERTIAALEWSCEHCGEATTRGAKAAHLQTCPQLPTTCEAAAAGCGWAGVLAEQPAHEAACTYVICKRVTAPLQAQNQQLQAQCTGLQSECQELRARMAPLQAQNQQLQAQCDGLQVQNFEVQQQVAALQPLAGRVRALEGDEEEGGRRQRQRVGPAGSLRLPPLPPLPPPLPPLPLGDAAVAEMGPAEVVAALRAHVEAARVVEMACWRLTVLCEQFGGSQAAAEAGALEAAVAAMWAHPQVAAVQRQGCRVLASMCFGDDAAARRQRAVAVGAIEEVVAAMRAHLQVELVQEYGCCALRNVCWGCDAAVPARRQRAAGAGTLEVLVTAMQAHLQAENVQGYGCGALINMCLGEDAATLARRQRAAGAGALEAVAAAMWAHLQVGAMQEQGDAALFSIRSLHPLRSLEFL